MRLVEHAEGMWGMKNSCTILFEKKKKCQRSLWRLGLERRTLLKWMFLQEVLGRTRARARVTRTLRLAIYRQSVCLGDKPLDTHDQ
jgi:hypothetical protein